MYIYIITVENICIYMCNQHQFRGSVRVTVDPYVTFHYIYNIYIYTLDFQGRLLLRSVIWTPRTNTIQNTVKTSGGIYLEDLGDRSLISPYGPIGVSSLHLPSLKLTSPLKMSHPKKKLVFQPSIFRCHLLVSGRV